MHICIYLLTYIFSCFVNAGLMPLKCSLILLLLETIFCIFCGSFIVPSVNLYLNMGSQNIANIMQLLLAWSRRKTAID